jgi:hypothetical protein
MSKTAVNQIKESYYKMSETEFHYWISQNFDRLLKEERDMLIKSCTKHNWATQIKEPYCKIKYMSGEGEE